MNIGKHRNISSTQKLRGKKEQWGKWSKRENPWRAWSFTCHMSQPEETNRVTSPNKIHWYLGVLKHTGEEILKPLLLLGLILGHQPQSVWSRCEFLLPHILLISWNPSLQVILPVVSSFHRRYFHSRLGSNEFWKSFWTMFLSLQ